MATVIVYTDSMHSAAIGTDMFEANPSASDERPLGEYKIRLVTLMYIIILMVIWLSSLDSVSYFPVVTITN
jgi:hypothetical protein